MKIQTWAILFCVGAASAGQAEVVLDQQHAFTSSIANSTNGDVTLVGQTFTVGVAGTLDHIDVFMFRLGGIFDPTGDPVLRVYNTAGGLPTGAALITVSIGEALVPLNNPDFVTFDVSSAAISITPGQVLAFSLTAASGVGPYFLPTDQGQQIEYPGGDAVINFGGNGWQFLTPPQDHSFRTYVDTVGGVEMVTADSYSTFRGLHVSGTLEDTFASDNKYLKFNPGITLSPTEPPVWLIFNGTLPTDSPATLSIKLEAKTNTLGLNQTIDAFNWNSQQYQQVSSTNASFNTDSVVTVDLTTGIGSYVQPATGAVRVRIGWRATGPVVLFPWTICVDQVVWEVS
jgi:hypothetical protein